MTQTFLHIGLHKTATTYLQNKVFAGGENFHLLSRPYTQLNHAFNKLQYANDSLYNEEDMLAEVQKLSGKKILVSDEMLSGQPYYNYINRSMIARRLKSIFSDATVIIFIRGQHDIVLSMYSQWIKALGGTETLNSFLWYPKRSYSYEEYHENLAKGSSSGVSFKGVKDSYYFWQDFFSIHLDNFLYFEMISFYKNLFGKVHVFLYEDFKNQPEKIVLELQDILGEKLNRIEPKTSNSKVNTRLSPQEIEMYRFNNVLKKMNLNPLLHKIFRGSYKLGLNFSENIFERESNMLKKLIFEFYKEDNRRLISEYPDIGIQNHPCQYCV